MRTLCFVLMHFLSTAFRHRLTLQLEIVALRDQLAVHERSQPSRFRIEPVDRALWSWLAWLCCYFIGEHRERELNKDGLCIDREEQVADFCSYWHCTQAFGWSAVSEARTDDGVRVAESSTPVRSG